MAVVFITGGSSGIGLATVRRLAAAGDQVFCGSRHPTRVPLPAGVAPVPMDVSDPGAAERAVRSVTDAAGRLDVLVNDIAPAPFGGWYSASKAALASLSAVLDAELHGTGVFVTVIAPGLFRTAMSEQLPFCQVADGSGYARAFESLRSSNGVALESAGDPDEVASAIEDCIRADEPPARVVVGADGAAMDQTIRQTSAEDLAKLLREFVAGLT
jgi:NAD(P)-dependent dehydrogenase (short-subunit alcohol dehydrogenase family)